jgi:hypothetical protein
VLLTSDQEHSAIRRVVTSDDLGRTRNGEW